MIQNINENTKNAIKQKSVFNLPDRPSDLGMTPTDIKKAFYQPIIDINNSALSELDRVINETNNEIVALNNSITSVSNSIQNSVTSSALCVTQTQNALEDLEELIDSVETNINNFTSSNNTVLQSVAQATTTVGNFENRVTELENACDLLEERNNRFHLETLSFVQSNWQETNDYAPFTHYYPINVTGTNFDFIELINDNPVLFSNYGFSLMEVSQNNFLLLALSNPTENINLKFYYCCDSGSISLDTTNE